MEQSVHKYPADTDTVSPSQHPPEPTQVTNYIPQSVQDGFLTRLSRPFADARNNVEHKEALWIAAFGFFNYCLSLLIIKLPYFSPVIEKTNGLVSMLFSLLTFPIAYYVFLPIAERALTDIRRRLLSADVTLTLAAILGLIGLAYMLVFDRAKLPLLSLDAAMLSFVFVVALSNYIEAGLIERISRKCGISLARICPRVNRLLPDGSGFEPAGFATVAVGDVLSVSSGEVVAFDGEVLDGQAQVMEARHSLLRTPCQKQTADRVYSGSEVTSGNLVFKVSALETEALSSHFVDALNKKFVQDAEKEAQKYNLNQIVCNFTLIALALAAGIYWYARYQNLAVALNVAVAILSVTLISKLLYLHLCLPIYLEGVAFFNGILAAKDKLKSLFEGIERYVIDFDAEKDVRNSVHTKNFELVDKRLDENSLPSLLFALAGRGEGQEALAIAEFINNQKSGINVFQVEEFSEHPGRGLCGKVLGSEFTLGSEDFLLERGVLLQPSDVTDEEPEEGYYWYMALERDVIACLHFLSLPSAEIASEIESLRENELRLTICSLQESDRVDRAAQALGFELADIYGGLTPSNYSKKLESLRPFALLASADLERSLAEKADVIISEFDEVLFDIHRSDVVLFGDKLKSFAKAIKLPALAAKIGRQNMYASSALTVMLVLLASLNLLSPAITLLAVLCASVAMQLNILRLDIQ